MSWIRRLKVKLKGVDPFYEELDEQEIDSCQKYFEMVIRATDLATQTAWAQSRDYDQGQMDRDEELMEQIIANDAVKAGLQPMVLQIMVNQYFLADTYLRERDRETWVDRVIHRKDVDYFPAANNVYLALNAMR